TQPSISLVTSGTTPQRAHTWNVAVRVPNAYLDTRPASAIATVRRARGFDVQTPPCVLQNVQSQARAGISGGSPSQSSRKAMLPQWHWPSMRIAMDEL